MRNAKYRNAKYEMRNTKSWTCTKNRKGVEMVEMIEIGDCGLTKRPRRWRHLLIEKRTKIAKRSDISAIWWHHWELTGQVENVDRARPNEGGETQRAPWWPILQVVIERDETWASEVRGRADSRSNALPWEILPPIPTPNDTSKC